jgi:hypothetical protein
VIEVNNTRGLAHWPGREQPVESKIALKVIEDVP